MPKSHRRIYRERLSGAWTHASNLEKFFLFMIEPLTRANRKEELEFISISLRFIGEIKAFIRYLEELVDGCYYEMEGYVVDSPAEGSECEGH